MSTLSHEQQYLDAKSAYHDNADYDETGSLEKARKFRTACRRLLGILPAMATMPGGQEQVRYELKLFADEAKRAADWISKKSLADSQIIYEQPYIRDC